MDVDVDGRRKQMQSERVNRLSRRLHDPRRELHDPASLDADVPFDGSRREHDAGMLNDEVERHGT